MNKKNTGTKRSSSERLAKNLARSGVASRRESEKLILAGRVEVNGKVILTPAFNVTANDQIKFDGKLLTKPPLRVWLYHKPTGLVTTKRDEKGRATIYDKLPRELSEVNTVGRLDLNSEGLLVLTNDGELKRRLELPETGWRRKYRVRAFGKIAEQQIQNMREGVIIDGEKFRPMEVEFDRAQGDNAWYTVAIREGRNREIRRIFEYFGLVVNRLIRVSYGPFQLGSMQKGEVSELRRRALTSLLGGLIPENVEIAETALELNREEKVETNKLLKTSRIQNDRAKPSRYESKNKTNPSKRNSR